ncbi:MAG TPA: ABC transporter ATP-binding protein [Chitinophagaceae bacterium]|nr:ABC transporter ATP-binding protein [Chitinophagaceae bacterium]
MFLYLFLSVVISFMDGVGLAMFIPLLQFVTDKSGSNAQSLGHLHYLVGFMQSIGLQLNVRSVLLIVISLFCLKGCFKFVQLAYYARLRQLFIRKVRYNLIEGLQGLSYSAFLTMDAGKIQNTLTTDVARLFQTMAYYFSAAQTFVMLLNYILLAFLANYQFALLVCVGSIISNIVYKRIYRATKEASIEISNKGSDFNGFLIQSIHYFKYLKSTNTFPVYSNKLTAVVSKTESINRKIGNLKALAVSSKEPVIITIVCIVILVQIQWLGTAMNTVLLSLLLFYRALSSLVSLQNDWQGFIENSGGMDAVATMADEMEHYREINGTMQIKTIRSGIVLQNVLFSYGKTKVLKGINMVIPIKKTIALVGESGAGKTTIANLIAGLITAQHGDVLVDNIPVRDMKLESFRSKIGYISQESVVFNDTIFNNITFWAERTPSNIARFNEVVEMASLSNFIAALPEKEATKMGDFGILISGGQKQRVSIARELFKEAEILIFDEATSALDSETEKIIQNNIQRLHGLRTVILIAHRLSTIKEADIIYLCENGKITASGSFEEIVLTSSRFKKMVELQGI